MLIEVDAAHACERERTLPIQLDQLRISCLRSGARCQTQHGVRTLAHLRTYVLRCSTRHVDRINNNQQMDWHRQAPIGWIKQTVQQDGKV